jgi:hypothetical protein
MKVAAGVDVPNRLHFVVVASMDFGVNGDFLGVFRFSSMSNLPSSGPVLPAIKPTMDLECPAPPNINTLPTLLRSMNMHLPFCLAQV